MTQFLSAAAQDPWPRKSEGDPRGPKGLGAGGEQTAPAILSGCLSPSVPVGRPREGLFLPLIHMGLSSLQPVKHCSQPQHWQQEGTGEGQPRPAVPSEFLPKRHGPGCPKQPVCPSPKLLTNSPENGVENPPLTSSRRNPVFPISTRAGWASLPAHKGLKIALPPQEGQEPRVWSWLGPLVPQGISRCGGLQDRAGRAKPEPCPTIGEDGVIRRWTSETQESRD